MRLLLTAFEAFGASDVNPSEQVVHALAARPSAGVEMATASLPVDCRLGPETLLQALQEAQPEVVICLGEATGRAAISIERVAINLLDFHIPDNQGMHVVDAAIVPGGPAAYFVTLPVRRMAEAVRAAGVPVELSLNAGSYLCNQVLYVLLDYLTRQALDLPAGFIHLPALPEQAARREAKGAGSLLPSMSLETMVKGVEAAIRVALTQRVNPG